MSQQYQLLPSSPFLSRSSVSSASGRPADDAPEHPSTFRAVTVNTYPTHLPSPRFDSDLSSASSQSGWRSNWKGKLWDRREGGTKGKQVSRVRSAGSIDSQEDGSEKELLPLYEGSFAVIPPCETVRRWRWTTLLALGAVAATSALLIYWKPEGPSGLRNVFRAKALSGADGSWVVTEDGESFLYQNQFGGTWDAVGVTARPQNHTPPLSTPWDYEKHSIIGVNLGGWLTLEPFITPALFEPFVDSRIPAVDEWTLSLNLGDQLREVVEEHYRTFITEKDFAEIAGSGLNWVRIPVPFWAIEVVEGEPYLPRVSWNYFLKAVRWARKYGLRINLDLHSAPGSQNGWNHSGRMGDVGFLNGRSGIENAERTLKHIRALAEFISLPGNAEVTPMLGILNEPFQQVIDSDVLRRFYYQAYETVRNVTGIGKGHGPMISIHDGFKGHAAWDGFLEGADRLSLDYHYYLAFRTPNDEPLPIQALKPCTKWAAKFNKTMNNFGVATVGEWSLGVNDCGRFLNGVQLGHRYDGTFPNATASEFESVGSCEDWNDYTSWTEERKLGLQKFARASMDSARNHFFWTWKTGITLTTNRISSPLWSYSLGLKEGYIPKDPRQAQGACDAIAEELNVPMPRKSLWKGSFLPWQIGGQGAGAIVEDEVRAWGEFPSSSPSLGEPKYPSSGGFPIVLPIDVAYPSKG